MPFPFFFYCRALCKAPRGTCVMEHTWGNEARLAVRWCPAGPRGRERRHTGVTGVTAARVGVLTTAVALARAPDSVVSSPLPGGRCCGPLYR